MDARNPLDMLDGSSGHASGRLGEILASFESLADVPDIVWTWLQQGSAASWWPYLFIPLALVFVVGARLGMVVTLAVMHRRRGPMAPGAFRRPLFAWAVGAGVAAVLFLLSEKASGPPRQFATAILIAYLLAHLVTLMIESVLGRYRTQLQGERLAALQRAIRLARGTNAYGFALLALAMLLHLVAVPLEPRILVGIVLMVVLALLGLLLVQRLKATGVVLPPLATHEAQQRRTMLLRIFARVWTKFYSLFIAAVAIISIYSALDAMDAALLRGWASLLLFAVIPMLMVLLGDLVREEAEEGPPRSPWFHTLLHGLRLMLVALGWLGLARIWGMDLLDLANEGLGERMADAVISLALILLLSHLAWEVIRTLIDVHAGPKPAAHGADLDEVAHGTQSASRLQTFAPLLRKFIFAVLVVMAACLMLSSLGVEIGPLLAGAGVVGIAIGFGAQTLVRDIVSGIFFLLDDAFRIGEYVEIGEIRGTVEGMSIRSLKLRHQRGAIHTLPFGEITRLTNYSRDWQVLRLDFQFAYGTDVEKIRKLVKDLGKKLMADPTYGPMFIAPLKSQGVRGTSPIGLTIGIKFTAKPGTQYLLRREVYRQLCESFINNHIEFAQPRVLVQAVHDTHLTQEQLEQAASAATGLSEVMPEKK